MKYRVLVVDDEPLARRGVIIRLRKFPDVEVVGECADGEQALVAIAEQKPDLLFLDIQMPQMDGFEMLAHLDLEQAPQVLFLTAYEEHALRAFQVHALDYLLKPIDDLRFAEAVQRALHLLSLKRDAWFQERLQALLCDLPKYRTYPKNQRFLIRHGKRIAFVSEEDVDWIEAQGDYAALHVGDKAHLLREPLHTLEGRLDPQLFVRIHRSAIVRLDRISELYGSPNRDYSLRLKNGTPLRVSRTYSDRLLQMLGFS